METLTKIAGSASTSVTVALDWTPNTNHTGFYIALAKGFYSDAHLDVKLLSPHTDDYKVTPASRLMDNSAQFAITPSETVVSYHCQQKETDPCSASALSAGSATQRPPVVAVAALLADSTSAIVTLASSGLARPAQLDGKVYASYGARYEGRIVQQMIKNDGGAGKFIESTPPMLGIWHTLLKGEADATWVFMGWEGVEARRKGVELNTFKLEDFGVAYGYSPVLVTHPDIIRDQPALVSSFLAATSKGYTWAAANPAEAAELFLSTVSEHHAAAPAPEPLDAEMVREAQAYTSQHYIGPSGQWGMMAEAVWQDFLKWLSSQGLLTQKLQSRTPVEGVSTSLDGLREGDVGRSIPLTDLAASSLFSNAYLPATENCV
ncbi:MAG: hypothetical protein WDW38_008333 [Sanguina aurantia]